LVLVELFFKETSAIAVHGRLIPIDTEVLGNIAAVQLKPGDKGERAETL